MAKQLIYLSLLSFLLLTSCSTESTPIYTLTTEVNPPEAGSVSPATGEYDEGTEIGITATPNENWVFESWHGDYIGESNPATITIDSDKQITAIFAERTYALTIYTEGEGSVREQVIQSKTNEYPTGTTVQLTAEPEEGWEFVQWEGNLTGKENPASVEIIEPLFITAIFEELNLDFAGGTGSEANPYQVSTLDQLQAINDYKDDHFVQINEIDASETINWNNGKGFTPIGDDRNRFTGSYNGGGYKISGLKIDLGSNEFVGLFGFVEGGLIKNTVLENVDIVGGLWVGALAGAIESTEIINSHATGNLHGNSYFVGGLLGWALDGSTISHSSVNMNVSGDSDIGGLIGVLGGKGIVRNSFSAGTVTGQDVTGGLVMSNIGTIVDSYSIADVVGKDITGGLVGTNDRDGVNNIDGKVITSYATGTVIAKGDTDPGGLIGKNSATIEAIYWDTQSTGLDNAIGTGNTNTEGATGLSTSQMKGTTAQEYMPEFDWENIWRTTNGYPELRWTD